jgi:hypothetical protein
MLPWQAPISPGLHHDPDLAIDVDDFAVLLAPHTDAG